jgi:peptidyl-prolyl cis-trans isomerase SurA
MIKSIALFFFILSISQAALLDKTIAVFNDKVITLSEVERVKSNFATRKNVAPNVYNVGDVSVDKVTTLIINKFIIREKISELGYNISDDQVESQIKTTESRLNLNRQALLSFLKGNNITFDEYFEIIRESIEYNVFQDRIIEPLISVTEQEIKNAFFKENTQNKALAIKYSLVGYSITKTANYSGDRFLASIKAYQKTGTLAEEYKNVEIINLGDVTEDTLTKDLVKLLKDTDEGSFSTPFSANTKSTIYFVKGKDLAESEVFIKEKDHIRQRLLTKIAHDVSDVWLQREKTKHYIRTFF